MRKFLFVLLLTLLAAFTGCRSDELPDAAASSASDSAKTISEASAMNTCPDESISSGDSSSSDTGDTSSAPSSDAAEDPSSASTDNATAATSQKPAAPAEQKPTAAPEQTNPPESASGSSSSASASPAPPITPPSEGKPTAPELPVSGQPEPPVSQPPETTSQPDMEAEYARIIRETVAYAESYAAKGFTFVWDDSLEFSWESGAGWMGTPRVKYEGVDGTIEMLKYHIDKIVKIAGGPGTPGYSAYYKIMQVTVDGDIAFVVLYG